MQAFIAYAFNFDCCKGNTEETKQTLILNGATVKNNQFEEDTSKASNRSYKHYKKLKQQHLLQQEEKQANENQPQNKQKLKKMIKDNNEVKSKKNKEQLQQHSMTQNRRAQEKRLTYSILPSNAPISGGQNSQESSQSDQVSLNDSILLSNAPIPGSQISQQLSQSDQVGCLFLQDSDQNHSAKKERDSLIYKESPLVNQANIKKVMSSVDKLDFVQNQSKISNSRLKCKTSYSCDQIYVFTPVYERSNNTTAGANKNSVHTCAVQVNEVDEELKEQYPGSDESSEKLTPTINGARIRSQKDQQAMVRLSNDSLGDVDLKDVNATQSDQQLDTLNRSADDRTQLPAPSMQNTAGTNNQMTNLRREPFRFPFSSSDSSDNTNHNEGQATWTFHNSDKRGPYVFELPAEEQLDADQQKLYDQLLMRRAEGRERHVLYKQAGIVSRAAALRSFHS